MIHKLIHNANKSPFFLLEFLFPRKRHVHNWYSTDICRPQKVASCLSGNYARYPQRLNRKTKAQESQLGVIFRCKDGDQRCSTHALYFMSDYYSHQLDALDRFENEIIFTCPFSKPVRGFIWQSFDQTVFLTF